MYRIVCNWLASAPADGVAEIQIIPHDIPSVKLVKLTTEVFFAYMNYYVGEMAMEARSIKVCDVSSINSYERAMLTCS